MSLGSTLPDSPFVETLPVLGSSNSCVYFCVLPLALGRLVDQIPRHSAPVSMALQRTWSPGGPPEVPRRGPEGHGAEGTKAPPQHDLEGAPRGCSLSLFWLGESPVRGGLWLGSRRCLGDPMRGCSVDILRVSVRGGERSKKRVALLRVVFSGARLLRRVGRWF